MLILLSAAVAIMAALFAVLFGIPVATARYQRRQRKLRRAARRIETQGDPTFSRG